MRLEQLHYFEILSQESSFRKAAERLHITQPSLTSSIKALEKELDTTLLIRNTHGFTFTEDGKKVLQFAKEMTSSYQKLWHSIHSDTHQLSGNITIMTPKFFSELILEQLLQTLHEQYPQIKVRMIQNDYHTSTQFLTTTSCKFAIIQQITSEQNEMHTENVLISDENLYDSAYQYLPLFTDTLGFCVSKTSLLSKMNHVYPDTIDSTLYPMTVFPIGLVPFNEKVLLSSNNPKFHVDAMVQDNAYCPVPYFVYQHYFAQENAITYRTYSNKVLVSWYLVYPAEHILTEAEQIFILELQNFLTQVKFK